MRILLDFYTAMTTMIKNRKNKTLSKSSSPNKETVLDRKSTRLNSSHVSISYAVFCLKKKINKNRRNWVQRLLHPRVDNSGRRLRPIDCITSQSTYFHIVFTTCLDHYDLDDTTM